MSTHHCYCYGPTKSKVRGGSQGGLSLKLFRSCCQDRPDIWPVTKILSNNSFSGCSTVLLMLLECSRVIFAPRNFGTMLHGSGFELRHCILRVMECVGERNPLETQRRPSELVFQCIFLNQRYEESDNPCSNEKMVACGYRAADVLCGGGGLSNHRGYQAYLQQVEWKINEYLQIAQNAKLANCTRKWHIFVCLAATAKGANL